MKKITALLFAAATVTGCANTHSTGDVDAAKLQHHRYVLESVNGQALKQDGKPGRQPELNFGENLHVSGAMCNRFMGQGKLTGNTLKVDGMAMTRMMCVDPTLNELDGTINKMLSAGANVSIAQNQLTLTQGDTTLVYKLADLVQ
ncbi:heat shock protein HslJ [Erwinia sp. HR93]|uniref:heat shock protein HslJ n=1 Tax=Erwinia sp. HR93 TaxID=3094840 RepID=UPI002ADEB09F|nr:heat shock protein HslJ [Erwinia sp. HR93]MEA1064962.1 heat shock protein HslJ [Erwinia sp. HR93]